MKVPDVPILTSRGALPTAEERANVLRGLAQDSPTPPKPPEGPAKLIIPEGVRVPEK